MAIATQTRQRADFDPFSMEYRANPTAYYDAMFATSPGFLTVEGTPSAFVAPYAQCSDVLRDFKSFSSVKPKGLPGMERFDFFNGLPVMNYSDPPDHNRRRKIVFPAFTPKRTESLKEEAAKLIETILDGAIREGGFEAGAELGRPVAIEVMLRRFLGVPDEDHHVFMDYMAAIPLLAALNPGDPKPKAFLDAWEKGKAYCHQQHELALRGELNNLIGVIANSSEDGALSEDEMMAMMVVLLTGGVATIAASITASLMNLVRHPDVGERMRKDATVAAAHLEETLRLDSPVSLMMRFATDDITMGGKTIPKGMPVYVMNAAACHDPSVFPDPRRFNIDRPNGRAHLAFGIGIHVCIGNAIVRNVVPMLTHMVACRMPNLRLADRPDALVWDLNTARARHLKVLHLAV